MEKTKVSSRCKPVEELKHKVTYRFAPDVIAILNDHSEVTRVTKTRIIEDLIRSLAK